MPKLRLCILVIISMLLVPAVWAQLVPRQLAAEAAKQQARRVGITPLAGCTPTPISIPTTRTGTLTALSCYDSVINSLEDIYTFTGTAGQTITVDYSSTQYETFVYFENLVSYIDGTVQTTPLSSGVSRSRFTYTFTQTRTYKLETESL